MVEPITWSTGHTYKAVHRLHQAVGLTNDLCTSIGLLRGYNSLGKPNNLFFTLGLIGRIELEDGIKDGIEIQASGTMTMAYSESCRTSGEGRGPLCHVCLRRNGVEVRSEVPKDCCSIDVGWIQVVPQVVRNILVCVVGGLYGIPDR